MRNKTVHQRKVIKYFSEKANSYDMIENQYYWRFADKLLWIKFKRILKKLPKDFSFVDAGGGTGRWTLKVLKNFPLSTGIIYDFSPEMSKVARKKGKKYIDSKRLTIVEGDLINLSIENKDTWESCNA